MLTRNDPSARPVAITMGDPAGVGPDIALAAWQARKSQLLPPFFIIGDPELFRARAHLLGVDAPLRECDPSEDISRVFESALPVVPVSLPAPVQPGVPNPQSAPAIIKAIELGVALVHEGKAAAVVTNPINKALLLETGFSHPGHTEFLGELARRHGGEAFPVMMLASEELKVVPVTVHMPFRTVPDALSETLVLRTIEVTAHGLSRLFGIARPRIAVTGLNPHAGESGALGREEIDIIAPAIGKARDGVSCDVTGPYPADTVFQERLRPDYDAVITMYHDQALIPIKTLAFDRAVNLTLGLPFIRTSPDHGTAYDLAGAGKASATSLIEAIRLAAKLAATSGTTV